MAITNKEINTYFGAEVTARPGGEHLNRCYSCGACSGACPVSQAIPEFDPRRFIHMIRMGLKERLLSSEVLWYCSNCRNCVFVCPQDVKFAEIVGALRELALEQGLLSDQAMLEQGRSAWVDRDQCVSCLTCVRVCPWRIPVIDQGGRAYIDPKGCRACGICPAECPVEAIHLKESADEQLIAAAGSGR